MKEDQPNPATKLVVMFGIAVMIISFLFWEDMISLLRSVYNYTIGE